MRDWKPVSEDEIYVVLAFFMLMCIVHNSMIILYFSRNVIMATGVFCPVIILDLSESVYKLTRFNSNRKDTHLGPLKQET
jgi:hypothetical protein